MFAEKLVFSQKQDFRKKEKLSQRITKFYEQANRSTLASCGTPNFRLMNHNQKAYFCKTNDWNEKKP